MRSDVLNDALFASMASSVKPTAEAQSLPPLCYTDPAFFEFEREALFGREWLCAGRVAWVDKVGDYFTTTHAGEPIVVVRTREGTIKALSSVCQHRARLVAEGHGNTRGFVCPYHHWSYDLDGRLVGAPAMSKTCEFKREDVRLPELKVEIWHGFVFVAHDLDAPPLAPRLGIADLAVAPFDLANSEGPMPDAPMHFAWNWKVMLENNNDGYHANRLHKGPLHDFIPSDLSYFPPLPEGEAGYVRYNETLHKDASFNPLQRAVLPVFPTLSDHDRGRVTFVNVPPTLSLVMTSDLVIYLILHAETASNHSMTMGYLVAPGASKEPLFQDRLDMNMKASMEISEQDFHVDALVQKGLGSRYAPRGRYSWQEQAQRELNVWLVSRYQAEWQRMNAGQSRDLVSTNQT